MKINLFYLNFKERSNETDIVLHSSIRILYHIDRLYEFFFKIKSFDTILSDFMINIL